MGTDLYGFFEAQDKDKEWHLLVDLSELLIRNYGLYSYFFQYYDDNTWLCDESKHSLIPERGFPDDLSEDGKAIIERHSSGYRHSWASWDELKGVDLDTILLCEPYAPVPKGWRIAWAMMRLWAKYFEGDTPLRLVIWFVP